MLTNRDDDARAARAEHLDRREGLLGREAIGDALEEVRDGLAAGLASRPRTVEPRLEGPAQRGIARRLPRERRSGPPPLRRRERETHERAAPERPLRDRSEPSCDVEQPRSRPDRERDALHQR